MDNITAGVVEFDVSEVICLPVRFIDWVRCINYRLHVGFRFQDNRSYCSEVFRASRHMIRANISRENKDA